MGSYRAWLFFLVCTAAALKLPDYMKQCSSKDPDLNQCALRSGRDAIPILMKGDRKFGVPVLDPLFIKKLTSNESFLSATALDVTVTGLEGGTLQSISLDLNRRHVELVYSVPKVLFRGNYVMTGKLVTLPIAGHGDFNLTGYDAVANYSTDYSLQERPDGHKYVVPADYDMDIDVSNLHVKLGNLFNGNKLLADAMNDFLNENWREVVKELGRPLFRALGLVVHEILSEVCSKVPYHELFSDT